MANLGRVSLYCVENVDQNQKDGDEERHSSRYNLAEQTIISYCCEREREVVTGQVMTLQIYLLIWVSFVCILISHTNKSVIDPPESQSAVKY